ncbi:MAG: hypothetical protein JW864_08630 [Spirochaetes bacterium]|nr:hypothetical protein [Spirochaetota bacterium]
MKILLLFLVANSVNLSFNYKETSPHSLFPYYTAVSDNSPLGHISSPAYLPLWKSWYIGIDYGKPYFMKEMNSANLRAGGFFKNSAFQAAWNRFGIKEYNEDIFEANAGYSPWNFISAGIGASVYRLSINTDEIDFDYTVTDFRFALLLLPFEWFQCGFLQENIYSIFDGNEEEDFLYPSCSFGISILPARGISLSWNLNRVYYGYINSFSITANMLSNLNLKAGYSRETSSYSMAVNFIFRHLIASYGLSYHSYLGSTHKLGITLSSELFRYEKVNYNKKLYRHIFPERFKTVYVNSSTLEELEESNLFSGETAERIIKYRKIIGPVSRKGLIQIGMHEKEIKEKIKYIKGLADDSKTENNKTRKKRSHYRTKNKKITDIDTRKLLFQKLLEAGLTSSDALHIAEFARDKSLKEVTNMINNSETIDNKIKPGILKICKDLL